MRQFGQASWSKELGRPTVKDSLIWINVTPHDGIPRRVGAWPGETLLAAIERHNIFGIPADCEGGDPEFPVWMQPYDYYSVGVMCSKCQVVIPEEWNARIAKPDVEREYIEGANDPITDASRLACCIEVRDWMQEMPVHIGVNRSISGEWMSENQ